MSLYQLPRFTLSACALAACTAVGAQTPASNPTTTNNPTTTSYASNLSNASNTTTTIVITGNPLGRDTAGQPASVLAGDGLVLRRAGTLGETLDGLPGVSSTWFGPNSSRPVIRGLDGDRVRLLDNGAVASDASNLSFDHAVGTDPLVAERLEVLRGPAALLYGGNATGGVVNSIDNRIPRAPVSGLGGHAEVRLGGAASERAGGLVLEGGAVGGRDTAGGTGGGTDSLAWHVDAYGRDTDDLRVPNHMPVAEGEALAPSTRVRNSAGRAQGGAVGASWVGEHGYLGLSVDTLRNRYGVTAEEDVSIAMQRDRVSLAGELRGLPGFIRQATLRASQTDYRHTEFEGADIGTVFDSSGHEVRAEFRHAPLGGVEGVLGLQAEALDFAALGAEAFVPGTRTRSRSAFLVESFQAGPVALTSGARVEAVRVASAGDNAEAEESRFGQASERRFTPTSASLGAVLPLAAGWQLNASAGHTERAPAYYELYANGLHIATAAYERGDPSLPTERSRHVEAGLAWKQGAHSLSLNVYQTRFSRYIALDATGELIEVEDEHHGEEGVEDEGGEEALTLVPEYAFSAVRARLRGFELAGRWRLAERPWALDFTGGVDLVRGDNLDTGEPLPRLAPVRVRAGLEMSLDGWRAAATLRHAARQNRVPAMDRATDSHTQLDLSASGPLPALAQGATWFAKLSNVTDELAYNASTIATLRSLAPLPGRALSAGVHLRF
jgi:iron complex outermembrane recepter protein